MPDNPIEYGFRWQRGAFGRADLQPREEFVASGYQAAPGAVNVDLNRGDPVKRVSDGSIALAVAGDPIYGVIVGGFQYYDANLGVVVPGRKLPGATAWTGFGNRSRCLVVPFAGQIFEIDCDDAVTATTEAAFGAFYQENADITINADATTKQARPRLDISTHNTTNTLVCRIHRLSTRIDQYFDGNYVKMLIEGNVTQNAPFAPLGV